MSSIDDREALIRRLEEENRKERIRTEEVEHRLWQAETSLRSARRAWMYLTTSLTEGEERG